MNCLLLIQLSFIRHLTCPLSKSLITVIQALQALQALQAEPFENSNYYHSNLKLLRQESQVICPLIYSFPTL